MAKVVTLWIIRSGERIPRFITPYPAYVPMQFRLLDVVVLNRDLAREGLRKGDLGTVVELYPPDGLEVEFVTGSGRSKALVAVEARDIRSPGDGDVFAVRPAPTPD